MLLFGDPVLQLSPQNVHGDVKLKAKGEQNGQSDENLSCLSESVGG